ncbi:hypothetical protein NLI96_g6675 [Meripilus lineatus]|uniref:Extracellular membrane protein CFEM domain-containing protein n=1 Tax=Meripilus lineatus TaxID=2056292 RepID=A0AAD5V0T8_9APHY|nr:hypothetical protein NLI96_g6675 [Physisporinus lineatus]
MLTLSVLSTIVLATQASAFTNFDDARSSLSDFLHVGSVFARQINPGDIPSAVSVPIIGTPARHANIDIGHQCRSDCAYTVAILNDETCVTVDCFCTATNNREFAKCFKCLAAGDAALLAESQATLWDYEDTCRDAGAPLASLTIVNSSPPSTRLVTTPSPISSSVFVTPSTPPVIVTPSSTPQVIVTPSTTPGGASRSVITPSSSGASIQSSGAPVPNSGAVSSAGVPRVVSIFLLLVGTMMLVL